MNKAVFVKLIPKNNRLVLKYSIKNTPVNAPTAAPKSHHVLVLEIAFQF